MFTKKLIYNWKNKGLSNGQIAARLFGILGIFTITLIVLFGPVYTHFSERKEFQKEIDIISHTTYENPIIDIKHMQILTERDYNKLELSFRSNFFYLMEEMIRRLSNDMEEYTLEKGNYELYEKIITTNKIHKNTISTYKREYREYVQTFQILTSMLQLYFYDYNNLFRKVPIINPVNNNSTENINEGTVN